MKGSGFRVMVLLGTSDSKLECIATAVIKVTLLWVWVTQQHASFLMGAELMGREQCHLERELIPSNMFISSKNLCLKCLCIFYVLGDRVSKAQSVLFLSRSGFPADELNAFKNIPW